MSDTQINVGMNVDGVVAGTNKAKAELRTLQSEVDKVARASKEGGAALGKVGDGVDADKAAKQLSRLAQQVKRVSEEAVLGRNSVELFAEKLAKTGVSPETYRPLLDAYASVRKSTEQANAEFTKSGHLTHELVQGTKAYSAALRQVPAQFTDIVVSLQGGQAPMTVLLQQGGQLKDVFGSAGAAARALGGYVAGMVNPFTATAAAIGVVGYAAYKGAQDIKAFELALALSGNASGVTADQMRQLALATGSSADALAQFARAGVTGTEGLQKFADSAVRFEKYTGIAVKDSVAAWKSLGDEPVKNALKLNETVAFLTPTIYAQIKALEAQGKSFEASVLAQNAYAQAQQRIADGAESKLNSVAYGWDRIAKSIEGAWKRLKDFTNGDSTAKQIADAQARVKALQDTINAPIGFNTSYIAIAEAKEQLKIEQQRLFVLQSGQSLEQGTAREKAAQNKQLDAQLALDKEHDKYLSKAVERERELTKVREATARANKGLQEVVDYGGAGAEAARKTLLENQRKLAEAEEGIRKRFEERKPLAVKADAFRSDVANAYTKAMSELDAEQIKASSSADKLSKTQETLRRVQSGPEWAAMSRRQQEEVIMTASLSQAEEDRLATMRAAEAENAKYIASLTESATAHESKRQALSDEVAAYKVAIEKNISLAEAIEEVALARLQEQKAIEMSYGNDKAVEQLNREIKARKELAALKGVKADHAAEVEAGKAAAAATLAEWKRGWDETDRLAREVFTTWATDGSNAAQKIGDTLKKALLSAIYEATLKPLVFQLYTNLAGGSPGGALGAVNSAGSLLGGSGSSSLSGLSSLTGAFGSSLSAGFSSTIGSFGSTLGLSIEGGLASIAEGTSTAIASGLGQIAGAVAPIGLGIAAISALTSSTITANGSALLANLGGGTTQGVAIRSDFTQSSSGIFSGGTTHNSDWKDADAQVTQFIQQQVKLVTDSARAYGTALGLPVDSLDSFKKQIEVSLTGLDAAGVQKALQGAIDGFANDLVSSSFGDALKDFSKSGESAGTTLARVASEFTAVNSTLETLGSALLDLDAAGIKAADGLVQAMGGLEAFNQQMASYYQNFYSGDEQRAQTAKSIQSALADVGLDYSVEQILSATRAQFRALVEAQDITTDSGRTIYAALMKVSSAFANLTPTVESASKAAEEASRRAQEEAQRAAERAAQEARRAAEEARRAAEAYQRQLDAARDYIKGISTRISDFLASLDAQAQGLQSYNLAAAAFSAQMVLARGGDRNALDGITSSASTLVDAIRRESSSAAEANLRIGRVRGQLAGLPGQLSPEQFIVDAIETATGETGTTITDAAGAIISGYTDAIDSVIDTLDAGFDLLDANGSGGITLDEMRTALAGKATDSELTRLFDLIDVDNDGILSKLETANARANTFGAQVQAALHGDFDKLDTSVNNALDFGEFSAGLSGLASEDTLRETFNSIDTNGDGVISRLEALHTATTAVHNATLRVADNVSSITFDGLTFDAADPLKSIFTATKLAAEASASIWYRVTDGTLGAYVTLARNQNAEGARDIGSNIWGAANDWIGAGPNVRISNFPTGGGSAFASGGAFTNSIVSEPTWFNQSVMGEAGPEAIIPLKRTSTGDLGVQMVMPRLAQYGTGQQSQAALVDEIRALRADNHAQALALVQLQKRMTRLLERWDGNGLPRERVEA